MTAAPPQPRRRFFAPEVVQSSAMDCGPASLKCLLEGFGVPVSYGRLREACQTDVDGTSIDTMEEVAVQLGLEAEQIMIPVDHLLLPEARTLPAIVVVRLPSGVTHFIVVWRRLGPFVQVMDPATGRRWITGQQLLAELYVHTLPVPAAAWREWAGSDEFLTPLRRRLARLGLPPERAGARIEAALAGPDWRALASLDAAARLAEAIARSGGVRRGAQADRVLGHFFERARDEAAAEAEAIPPAYWSVRPAPPDPDDGEQIFLRGAVLVRVRGRRPPQPAGPVDAEPTAPADTAHLSPELVAALEAPPSRPGLELLRLLRADGLLAPIVLAAAMALAAAGVVVEALLLRGLIDLGRALGLVQQRLGATAALLVFAAALLLLELPLAAGLQRVGRRLDARLRAAFLAKIPRLSDRYFQSRLISDMAERSHSVHKLRLLPDLAGQLLQTTFAVILTAAGIAWLDPPSAPLAAIIAAVTIGLPLAAQPLLAERNLRVRTHVGALGRFYLDALLGLVPVRTHGAERAVRREHESLLVEWARASLQLVRAGVTVEGLQTSIGFGLAAWLLFSHLARSSDTGSVLLLAYWALNLPVLGQKLVRLAQQYPLHRNVTLRLLEPLGAPETAPAQSPATASTQASAPQPAGVSIRIQGMSVRAAGHTILEKIDLAIGAGDHVAIVGPSGAGKTSLVGTLLGWHRAAGGQILVDGRPLDGERLEALRRETAWVDPAVQLWNRSFLENLRYGAPGGDNLPLGQVIDQADLLRLLETLPDGLQTPLGEGGALVSGGEGQRVRLGRALLRPGVRLAILDEPFRGLDRAQRRALLARARAWWREATLLCVTHDVSETRTFERVLVIEGGRLVEDGPPADLAKRPGSRYRALLEAEEAVRSGLWSSRDWRRLRLAQGQLAEENDEQVLN